MIRLQIAERPRAELFRRLKEAMRTGELRTFRLEKRGRKVVHVRYPGWMNWSGADGMVHCEILSPQKPGTEWQFLGAFLGRLAHRYSADIVTIGIQFPPAGDAARSRRKRR
jgi:hypothetical protein